MKSTSLNKVNLFTLFLFST